MNLKMTKLPTLEDEQIDTLVTLMDEMSRDLKRLTDVETQMDALAYVCSAECKPKEAPKVMLLASGWMKLASTVDKDALRIESHYECGPELGRPWNEFCFRLTFDYEGTKYFCLMDGSELDKYGIEVPDKEALMHGTVQS